MERKGQNSLPKHKLKERIKRIKIWVGVGGLGRVLLTSPKRELKIGLARWSLHVRFFSLITNGHVFYTIISFLFIFWSFKFYYLYLGPIFGKQKKKIILAPKKWIFFFRKTLKKASPETPEMGTNRPLKTPLRFLFC